MTAKKKKAGQSGLVPANGNPSSIVLYEAADGKVTVKVVFARETFWLTQKTMAELFGVNVPAVNKHLKNIFETGELVDYGRHVYDASQYQVTFSLHAD